MFDVRVRFPIVLTAAFGARFVRGGTASRFPVGLFLNGPGLQLSGLQNSVSALWALVL